MSIGMPDWAYSSNQRVLVLGTSLLAALRGGRSLAEFENVLPHFRLFTALVATRELRKVKKLWTKSLRILHTGDLEQ